MKTTLLSILSFLLIIPVFAQDNLGKLNFKFSGFVRGDVYFDSRKSITANDNLLFLYPKDEEYDVTGDDLNAQPNSGLYAFNSRPAVEVSGLRVFDADVNAFMEADFAGGSGISAFLRIRQAYLKMNWEKSTLLIGQTWHPFFNTIIPGQISLSTGAPFQPFNRSPQIRYDYKWNGFTFSGVLLSQFQYLSPGPDGKSNNYQKDGLLPELSAMIDYKVGAIQFGVGIDYLTLAPRTRSLVDEKTYKVDESISSLSYSAYFKYTEGLFNVGAKTTYGQNMAHLTMLGGYGIKSINPETGEQKYTNFNQSSSWLNLSYGSKYKGNLFLGYTKNLGSDDALVEGSKLYGDGMTVDDLYRVAGTFTYNIPHFTLGLEYEFSLVNYGDEGTYDWSKGKYNDTHNVSNHRVVGTVSYLF